MALVDDYMFRHVNLDTPDWYINPDFKTVLGSADGAGICAATPLTFAPGLLDVLQSDTPPSPEFFNSLPKPQGKFWAVYAALLTKEECEPGLSIGSGTDVIAGYRKRVAHYSDKKHPLLPRFVRALYDQGYELAHIGLLCWAPIPSAATVLRARLRFLAVEGTFTNVFYSAIPTCMDELWTVFMPWSRDDVLWRPLNSHTPFNESAGADLSLTPEELLRRDEERKRRAKQHSKKAYAKNAKLMREQYDRERAQDIDAFRLKKRIQGASWTARNKSKVSTVNVRSKKKAKVECRFYCKPCQKPFSDSTKLKRHENTTRHKNNVIGRAPTAKARQQRKYSASLIASKTFHCATCNQSFGSPNHLEAHKLTKKHLNKLTS